MVSQVLITGSHGRRIVYTCMLTLWALLQALGFHYTSRTAKYTCRLLNEVLCELLHLVSWTLWKEEFTIHGLQ